jgi:hypothetical protein
MSPLKCHPTFHFIVVIMAQTSDLEGPFIFSTIKEKYWMSFRPQMKRLNVRTTERKVTGCI